MNILKDICDTFPDEKFLSADGFDDAIIGVDDKSMRLIYSISKCIDILIADDMTYEEAQEYFEFNTQGAYVGEKTPIWCENRLILREMGNSVSLGDVWKYCDKEIKDIMEFEKEFRDDNHPCEYHQGMALAYRKIQYMIKKECSI